MSADRRWVGLLAGTGLALAALPAAVSGPGTAAQAQVTEPFPTLEPTRAFPTLPSNVPPPAPTATITPTLGTPSLTPTIPSDTPSPTESASATASPTATWTMVPTGTSSPTATRYLGLGRILHLPYAAQFDLLRGPDGAQRRLGP